MGTVRGERLSHHLHTDSSLIRATGEWLGRIKDALEPAHGQRTDDTQLARWREDGLVSRQSANWSPLAGSDSVPSDPDEIERAAMSLAGVARETTFNANRAPSHPSAWPPTPIDVHDGRVVISWR